METDVAIVGAGVVGLSVASGLLARGHRVTLLDEGDLAFRASRGNFGLVWVQGKGRSAPHYARWSRVSARAWGEFATELAESSGIQCSLQQRGGYSYHLNDESLEKMVREYDQLKDQLGGDYPFEVLGHNALRIEEPAIGPKVTGAILHHEDGHVNPLRFLQSLVSHNQRLGANILVNRQVQSVKAEAGGFTLDLNNLTNLTRTSQRASSETLTAGRVVLCAGLGSTRLGPDLGFLAPLRPQRGQVLVTSKMPALINRPSGTIRQVDEGGVQIGASEEEAGFDDQETVEVTANLARSAIDIFPSLQQASLVRSWSALRVMSPDGLPIYQQSKRYPGAFLVTCHSGITLAAAHARYLPLWIDAASDAPSLELFSENRFNDESTAPGTADFGTADSGSTENIRGDEPGTNEATTDDASRNNASRDNASRDNV